MKTKLFILGFMIAVSSLFTACQDDDHTDNTLGNKEKVLLSKYPQAQNINWRKSKDNKYDIATFTLPFTKVVAANADTVQVWFGQNDNIRLTHQEISFNALPAAVKKSFGKTKCNPLKGLSDATLLNTSYQDTQIWEIDDVYKLERDGAVSYKIEMDALYKDIEINLYYDEQGILLKEILDDDEEETPLEIPQSIKEWLDTNHKNAEILDYESDEEDHGKEHELDLKEGEIILEITLLEANGKLLLTEEEYNYPNLNALPDDVKNKALELLGTLTDITEEDIHEIEMEKEKNGNEVYSIELEKGNKEITIEITKDSQGNLSGETNED